jgi:hypothetical protein
VGHSGQDGVDALRDFALEQKCRCATHTTSQCTRALVRPVIVTAAKHDRGDSASILEHRDALARGTRLRMCAGIETQASGGKNALHSLCVRVVAEVTHELADRAVRRPEPCGCNCLIRTLAAKCSLRIRFACDDCLALGRKPIDLDDDVQIERPYNEQRWPRRRRQLGSTTGPRNVALRTGLRSDIRGVGNVAGGALYTGLHLSVFLSFAFDAQAEDNRRREYEQEGHLRHFYQKLARFNLKQVCLELVKFKFDFYVIEHK